MARLANRWGKNCSKGGGETYSRETGTRAALMEDLGWRQSVGQELLSLFIRLQGKIVLRREMVVKQGKTSVDSSLRAVHQAYRLPD
jgi:hypothetical protein